MKATCSSGHCATPAEVTCHGPSRWLVGVFGLLLPVLVNAAEAPTPQPLPPQAESAYQDLNVETREPVALDEAVFTEISPVTEPELGIRLPDDQTL